MQGKLIAVAVCAREDSLALRRLAKMLIPQETPPGWNWPSIIFVINQSRRLAADFEDFVKENLPSNRDIRVLFEPETGIPYARNAALAEARQCNIQWLSFIDDDCVPEGDWLYSLCSLVDQLGSDGAAGAWSIEPLTSPSRWIPGYVWGEQRYRRGFQDVRHGQSLATAYTRSVLFRTTWPLSGGKKLSNFDERLATRGGSDVAFFDEYVRGGHRLHFSSLSKVIETYSGERLRLRWHLKQRARNSQLVFERALVKQSSDFFFRTWIALTELLSAVVVLFGWPRTPRGVRGFRQRVGNFAIAITTPAAIALRLIGFRYHAYSDTWKWLR